mgnify:CR=1 FL=1
MLLIIYGHLHENGDNNNTITMVCETLQIIIINSFISSIEKITNTHPNIQQMQLNGKQQNHSTHFHTMLMEQKDLLSSYKRVSVQI